MIRNVQLPPKVKDAIEEKLSAEQQALRMQSYCRRNGRKPSASASRRRDRGFPEDRGPGHQRTAARWKGIEATQQLAHSQNAKIVIIGQSKNGMPLIIPTTRSSLRSQTPEARRPSGLPATHTLPHWGRYPARTNRSSSAIRPEERQPIWRADGPRGRWEIISLPLNSTGFTASGFSNVLCALMSPAVRIRPDILDGFQPRSSTVTCSPASDPGCRASHGHCRPCLSTPTCSRPGSCPCRRNSWRS